jgi:hypothetical protein
MVKEDEQRKARAEGVDSRVAALGVKARLCRRVRLDRQRSHESGPSPIERSNSWTSKLARLRHGANTALSAIVVIAR